MKEELMKKTVEELINIFIKNEEAQEDIPQLAIEAMLKQEESNLHKV